MSTDSYFHSHPRNTIPFKDGKPDLNEDWQYNNPAPGCLEVAWFKGWEPAITLLTSILTRHAGSELEQSHRYLITQELLHELAVATSVAIFQLRFDARSAMDSDLCTQPHMDSEVQKDMIQRLTELQYTADLLISSFDFEEFILTYSWN